MRLKPARLVSVVLLLSPIPLNADEAKSTVFPPGWQPVAARDEIRPRFTHDPHGGPNRKGCLSIIAEEREGLHGWWLKTIPVEGGKHYRFHAVHKVHQVGVPRRSAFARVLWQDNNGKAVLADPPDDLAGKGSLPRAEPEYPTDQDTDARGWTTVSATYRAPSKATRAVIELHLRWAPGGRIDWSEIDLKEAPPPPARKVRLASVHFRPSGGKTPMDNCRMFETHIAEAARKKADLVVLGETITYVGLGKKFADVAEAVPAPRRTISPHWPKSSTSTLLSDSSSATARCFTTSPC